MMDNVGKINNLISDFNALVTRRNKAEKWFDEPTTTDADRVKWNDSIFKLNDDIDAKAKELEALEFTMQKEFYWEGIGA